MKLSTTQWKTGTWSNPLETNLDSENTLIFIFASAPLESEAEIFKQVKNNFPRSQIIGCSTAGEIFQNQVFDQTISLAIAKFEKTTIQTKTAEMGSASDSREIGKSLAGQLIAPNLKAVFVVSDGIGVNGSELVQGISEVLPASVLVTGGLAGDGTQFKRTWQLNSGAPQSNIISMTGIYGDDIDVFTASFGGWDSFGPLRKVTRSEKNVLFEIDGQPALQLYKKYLAEKADELPGSALLYPLALRENENSKEVVVRTILSIDEVNQSMTFAGNIPLNSQVQLMHANFDRLVDGAAEAGAQSEVPNSPGPKLALAISCVGRRLVLGERTDEEIEAVLEKLPSQTQMIGFYSYGEISSGKLKTCQLHNQTMTLTIFSEKE